MFFNKTEEQKHERTKSLVDQHSPPYGPDQTTKLISGGVKRRNDENMYTESKDCFTFEGTENFSIKQTRRFH